MPRPDVTITLVSYNTQTLLRAALASIPAGAGILSYEIHVVDNASEDGSPEMVEREFPEVRLLRNEENLGFAAANNQSWRISQGRYWFLLNSDAELKPGALEQLVKFAEAHPHAGLTSARLENPNGTPQWCAQVDPAAWRLLLELSRLHKLLPPALRARLLGTLYFDYRIPRTLGYAWGTALLARREAVEQAGPLDESFWMYGEDLEWSLRLRRQGWEVWFCPQAEVIHHGGQSSEGRWTAPEKLQRLWDAHYRAIGMHRGAAFARRLKKAHLLTLQLDALSGRLKGAPTNPDIAPLVIYLQQNLETKVS